MSRWSWARGSEPNCRRSQPGASAKVENGTYLGPGAVVVFEVVSPNPGRTDRIVKVREYAAVTSIRRYVILESASMGLTVFERSDAGAPWRASTLIGDGTLLLPEIGIEIPVAEIYDTLIFPDPEPSPV